MDKRQLLFYFIILVTVSLVSFEREKAEISKKPLRWDTMPIRYHINTDCYKLVDRQKCFSAIEKSFETWETPDCTSLKFSRGEDVEDTRGSFDSLNLESNRNIIVWIYEDWPYESNGVALTTITYDDKTGRIFDADIELNGANFRFDILNGKPSINVDIQNTITHEIGHLIGLDHSFEPSSAMYPSARAGEIKKRELSSDDIDGICEIYPNKNGCNCSSLAY